MIQKNAAKRIAKERMDILFSLADQNKVSHPNRSKRYCELIDLIRKRFNIRLNKEQKKIFCKNCHIYWIKGKTVDIIEGTPLVYKCKICSTKRKL